VTGDKLSAVPTRDYAGFFNLPRTGVLGYSRPSLTGLNFDAAVQLPSITGNHADGKTTFAPLRVRLTANGIGHKWLSPGFMIVRSGENQFWELNAGKNFSPKREF